LWDMVVTNEGRDPVPGPIELSDTLIDALTYDGFDTLSDDVSCSMADQVVTCVYDNDLAAGDSFAVAVLTNVDSEYAGTITNNASVLSQSIIPHDDDPTNNSDTATADIAADLGEAPSALAFTGSETFRMVMGGLLLLLFGAALLLVTGRTRKEEVQL